MLRLTGFCSFALSPDLVVNSGIAIQEPTTQTQTRTRRQAGAASHSTEALTPAVPALIPSSSSNVHLRSSRMMMTPLQWRKSLWRTKRESTHPLGEDTRIHPAFACTLAHIPTFRSQDNIESHVHSSTDAQNSVQAEQVFEQSQSKQH